MSALIDNSRQFESTAPTDFVGQNQLSDSFAARQESFQQNRSWLEGAVMTPPAIFVSMMDTFAESFGLVEDQEVEEYLKNNLPDFGSFFQEHREALGFAGDIAGLFVPAGLAVKAVRATGTLAKVAEKTLGPGSLKYFSTGKSNQQIFQQLVEKGQVIARNRGRALELNPEFQVMKRQALGRSVADVAIEGVAADLAIASSMHSSDFLFPADMTLTDNIVFFAGGNLLVSGAAFAAAKYTLRNTMREIGPLAAQAQNPGRIPVSEAFGKVDNRGPAAMIYGATLQEVKGEQAAARQAGNTELLENTLAEQAAVEERLSTQFQRMFNDSPIEGVTSRVNFKELKEKKVPEIQTMLDFAEQHPADVVGLRSLELFDEAGSKGLERNLNLNLITSKDKIDVLKKRVDRLEIAQAKRRKPSEKLNQAVVKAKEELNALSAKFEDDLSTTGIVVEIDGLTSLPQKRGELFQDGQRLLKVYDSGITEAAVEKTGFQVSTGLDGQFKFTKKDFKSKKKFESTSVKPVELETSLLDDAISKEFKQQFPFDAKHFAQLSLLEKSAVYDTLQKSVERINPNTFKGFELPVNAHHTQLDYVLSLMDKHGADIADKIRGFTNREDIEYRSWKSKFEDFQLMKHNEQAVTKSYKSSVAYAEAVEAGEVQVLSLHDYARALNLPNADHPVLKMFHGALDNTKIMPAETLARDLNEVHAGLKSLVDGKPEEALSGALTTRGSMLDLSRNKRPVLTIQRTTEPGIDAITRDHMLTEVTRVKLDTFNKLRNSNTTIVKSVMDQIDGRPEQVKAFKDGMHQLMSGLDPSGKVMSLFVSQQFRNRGLPGFKAVDELTSTIEKITDTEIGKILTGPKQAFSKILEGQNRGDLVTFFTARTALGAGWDVAEILEYPGAAGKFGLSLKNTDRNKEIWKRLFQEEMPKQDRVWLPITGGQGKPVIMTPLATQALKGFNDISQTILNEVNTIRNARGLPLIAKKQIHLPPKDMSGQHVAYLMDDTGKIVTAVPASTQAEAITLAKKEQALASTSLSVVDEDVVRRHMSARFQAWFEMDDYSRPSRQTGPAKGTSFGETIEISSKTFQGMIEQQIKQLKDIERETRLLVFESEIDFLKMQKAASSLGGEKNSVYDRMINRIVGTQGINLDDASTVVGKGLLTIASMYDTLMQRIYDKLAPTMAQLPIRQVFAKKEFEATQKAFGPEFTPFNDFNDYLIKTANVRLPGELRKHAGALNEITTAMTIRVFDFGMGVVNLLSLASTLPPVIKMLQKTDDEIKLGEAGTKAQLDRIAAWGATTPNGISYFSPTRAVISGIHFMFSEEGRNLAKAAKEQGFFEQFAAEQVEIFGRTGEKFVTGLLRNAANKASWVTDKTETAARAISFMTFLNIGKKGLGLQDKAAMTFAHSQANNVIADFRPSNRPVMFQGAAGMPLGLFTTYMWNYLQRLYGMVESRQTKALVSQVGLQTFLFGAQSVPGITQYIQRFTENYDGTENIVDRLHKSIGPYATEAFLNGSISTLTGVSVGARASVGLPTLATDVLTGEAGIHDIPALRFLGRGIETVMKTVDSVVQEGGIDPAQIGTIIAQSGLNKFTSNAIEVAQGYAVDRTGNIIESNTRTALAIGSRIAGFKPLLADELREENRRNRTTERKRDALKARLADQLISKARSGKLDQTDIDDVLSDYVRAGGNAENFKRFFNSQVVKGTQNKLSLELAKALKQNNDENRVARLLFLSEQ